MKHAGGETRAQILAGKYELKILLRTDRRRQENIKVNVKETVCEHVSGQGYLVGSFKNGNELVGEINCVKFLD
jgi:hypothetical protein